MARLAGLNPGAVLLESHGGSAAAEAFAPGDVHLIRDLPKREYPVQGRGDVDRHDKHIHAHSFVLEHPVRWAGIAAWNRLVIDAFGDRLLRCKGLLRIADTGEIVFVQGVQRVFHPPERLREWPDADPRSRLVCITRDVDEAELLLTLRALDFPAGSEPTLPELN